MDFNLPLRCAIVLPAMPLATETAQVGLQHYSVQPAPAKFLCLTLRHARLIRLGTHLALAAIGRYVRNSNALCHFGLICDIRFPVFFTAAFAIRTADPSLAPRLKALLATADHCRFDFADLAFLVCDCASFGVQGMLLFYLRCQGSVAVRNSLSFSSIA